MSSVVFSQNPHSCLPGKKTGGKKGKRKKKVLLCANKIYREGHLIYWTGKWFMACICTALYQM